jgi:hypothetical protein
VALWCRAVSGWVESDESGREITTVPGVGGAERLADACNYWGKLLEMEARDNKWALPWYSRYLETAYAYYQWGQVDSERLGAAKRMLEVLLGEFPDFKGMTKDEALTKRFEWLWAKVR